MIEKYLYNDFSYVIRSGKMPFLVGSGVVFTRNTVPRLEWSIDFGKITLEFKNAIEEGIFIDYADLYFKSFVGPAFFIGKHVDILTSEVSYYVTYIFEYAYYGSFVNKPLNYIVDGTDHLIEGQIRIPIDHVEADEPLVIGSLELARKLYFLEADMKLVHNTNNISSFKATFIEQAEPLAVSVYKVGVSDVNHTTIC